jgi:hypothetical protein
MRAITDVGPAAGPAASGTVEVDFAGLDHLVATIRGLAAELAGHGDLGRYMNDPDLADTFQRVDDNWHKQRLALQTFWDTAATAVAASLAAYRQQEIQVARASRGVR